MGNPSLGVSSGIPPGSLMPDAIQVSLAVYFFKSMILKVNIKSLLIMFAHDAKISRMVNHHGNSRAE